MRDGDIACTQPTYAIRVAAAAIRPSGITLSEGEAAGQVQFLAPASEPDLFSAHLISSQFNYLRPLWEIDYFKVSDIAEIAIRNFCSLSGNSDF